MTIAEGLYAQLKALHDWLGWDAETRSVILSTLLVLLLTLIIAQVKGWALCLDVSLLMLTSRGE